MTILKLQLYHLFKEKEKYIGLSRCWNLEKNLEWIFGLFWVSNSSQVARGQNKFSIAEYIENMRIKYELKASQ